MGNIQSWSFGFYMIVVVAFLGEKRKKRRSLFLWMNISCQKRESLYWYMLNNIVETMKKNNFGLPYSNFEEWLDGILSNENEMSDEIVAFCFNLYEDADDYWSVELIGSASFDKDDDDWPCDEVFSTRETPLTWRFIMTYEECLHTIESHLSEYLQNGKYSKILLSKQGVGYGFVDGDLFLM